MNDLNLEDFLDLLMTQLDEMPPLAHHGVKGMHWGIRKGDTPVLKSLGPDRITRQTASGDSVTLLKRPPSKFNELAGRLSKKYRENYKNGAYFNIVDKNGTRVGEAEVYKTGPEEINLMWLGIKKSERGKGYASAVMKAATEFGRQSGVKRLTLEVPGDSPDARHIYEKLGFKYTGKTEGEKDDFWGGLSDMTLEFSDVKHHSFRESGMRMMNDAAKPPLSTLSHHGVKGMHWGQRKEKHTNREIHDAQQRQAQRAKEANDLLFVAANSTTAKSTDKALALAGKKIKELSTSEDRVTAEKLTRGQKLSLGLLGGPAGLIVIGTNHLHVDTAAKETDAFRRSLNK